MEEILMNCGQKPDLDKLPKYLGEPLAIFDIYQKMKNQKIVVGILDDFDYGLHKNLVMEKGSYDKYERILNILTMVMKTPESQTPAIYYLSNKPKKVRIIKSHVEGTSFAFPVKEDGTKIELTGSKEEFENKAREVAGEESKGLKKFLDYSKNFW